MNSNPTPDPRAELETRLTALLLGELSATEAAELNTAIARDPQLAQLHARLQQTIQLVREASAAAPQAVAGQTDSPRLSEERRAKLLAHFKTAPMPTAKQATPSPRRRELKWMLPLGLAAVFVGLISFAAIRLNDSPVAQKGLSPVSEKFFDQWKEIEKEDKHGLGLVKQSLHWQNAPSSPDLPIAEPQVAAASSAPASGAKTQGIVLPAGQDSSGSWGKPTDTAATASLGRSHAFETRYSTGSGVTLNEGTLQLGSTVNSLRAAGGKLTLDSDSDGLKNNNNLTLFSHGGVTTKNTAGLPSPAAPGAVVTFGSTAFSYDPAPAPTPTPSPSQFAERRPVAAHPSLPAERSVDLFINGNIIGSGGIAAASDLESQLTRGKSTVLGKAGVPILGDISVTDKPTVENEIRKEQPVPTDSPLVVNSPAPIAGTGLGFRKAGAGTLLITDATKSANSFSGGTVINAGTLSSGSVINGDNPVPKRPIIAGKGTVAVKRTENQELVKLQEASPISNGRDETSKFSVNKNGAAAWALTGANTYSGDTKVSGGTLLFRGMDLESQSPARTFQPSPSPELFALEGARPSSSPSGMSSGRDKINVDGTALTATNGLVFTDKNDFAAYDAVVTPLDKEKLQLGEATITLNGGTLVLGTAVPAIAQKVQNSIDAKPEAKGLSPLSRESDDLLRTDSKKKPADSPRREEELISKFNDSVPHKPAANAPVPQPEVLARENNFSTFSLNVSDVSFKLAAASLEKGQMPDPSTVRSEEFINAFDYRDPEPLPGVPIGFAWERAHYPFAHNRDLLRFSVKTAALGRQAGRPLNVVLLLDNSGSMERADRVSIVREALRVLASQLQAQDKLSVVTFARTPRLWVDGVSGDQAGKIAEQVGALTPEGGTNLEEAMNLGYQTALRHYIASGINHVVLLTDGAANLGNVEPESLKQKVEAHRKQGIALDCFGVGWEGFNDDLLEVLARNGDGRYGFINSPEEAATRFAGQLAGALHVAASDVKVQVEFNPRRVTSYRQIGYAKHQLTKEQFRDNTVDAAELAAQEAGNALYTIETNPRGEGPVCTVRVRFKVPGTGDYREHSWDVPFTGNAVSLELASHAMRLAATASAFSEWLVASPFAGEVTLDRLLTILSGIPEIYGADTRPKKLEGMIRQAKSVSGK